MGHKISPWEISALYWGQDETFFFEFHPNFTSKLISPSPLWGSTFILIFLTPISPVNYTNSNFILTSSFRVKDKFFSLTFSTKIIPFFDVESYVSRVLIIDKVIMIFYKMSDSDTSGCLIRSELSKTGKKNHLPRIGIPLTLLY